MKEASNYDVVIIGGGPAGQSSALVLGRTARSVLLADSGEPRNRYAASQRGFITRDGISPAKFHRAAAKDLASYKNIDITESLVVDVTTTDNGFAVAVPDRIATGRRLLFATGIAESPPLIDGIGDHLGDPVYGCVYCHGWELRGSKVAVIASSQCSVLTLDGKIGQAAAQAIHLSDMGALVSLFCLEHLSSQTGKLLAPFGIDLVYDSITTIERIDKTNAQIVLDNGKRIKFRALFVATIKSPRSELAEKLGCELVSDGRIKVNSYGSTSVPGVFAAGDVAKSRLTISQVIQSAAEGTHVGIVIDQDLLVERIRTVMSDLND